MLLGFLLFSYNKQNKEKNNSTATSAGIQLNSKSVMFCARLLFFTYCITLFVTYLLRSNTGEKKLTETKHKRFGEREETSPSLRSRIILNSCYFKINTCLNYTRKLLKWFFYFNLSSLKWLIQLPGRLLRRKTVECGCLFVLDPLLDLDT